MIAMNKLGKVRFLSASLVKFHGLFVDQFWITIIITIQFWITILILE